jgi:hypothetical protein
MLRTLHADTARWFNGLQRADLTPLLEMLLTLAHPSDLVQVLLYYTLFLFFNTE